MNHLVWKHDLNINEIFPLSYDLSDEKSDEFKDFECEMRFG